MLFLRYRQRLSLTYSLPCAGFAALLLLASAGVLAQQPHAPVSRRKFPAPKPPVVRLTQMRADDVIATVEGQPITRRELTYYWIQADARTSAALGSLVSDAWKANKGLSPTYTIPESAIYQRLYNDKNLIYANVLSSLITERLAAIEANKQGIVVTNAQGMAYAHEMFDQVRKQQNTQLSDNEIMTTFKVSRDLLLEDMMYRVRTEKLLAADIGRRNGHPMNANDWVVVRELFAAARTTSAEVGDESGFAKARERMEEAAALMKSGKSMEELARTNDDPTMATGGLRDALLRGGNVSKPLGDVIFQLKPGEISPPLRGRFGYYIFRVEKRGAQISEADRSTMWKQIVDMQKPAFLNEMRNKAQITSTVPLPTNPQQIEQPLFSTDFGGPPPPPGS